MYLSDKGPGIYDLEDTWRCVECSALIEQTFDLCEECALIPLPNEASVSVPDYIHGSDASHPHPL